MLKINHTSTFIHKMYTVQVRLEKNRLPFQKVNQIAATLWEPFDSAYNKWFKIFLHFDPENSVLTVYAKEIILLSLKIFL